MPTALDTVGFLTLFHVPGHHLALRTLHPNRNTWWEPGMPPFVGKDGTQFLDDGADPEAYLFMPACYGSRDEQVYENLSAAAALQVDIDNCGPLDALERCKTLKLPLPTVGVETRAGHCHLAWKFKKTLLMDTKEGREAYRAAQEGLQTLLMSDPGTTKPTQPFRIPGLPAWKNIEGKKVRYTPRIVFFYAENVTDFEDLPTPRGTLRYLNRPHHQRDFLEFFAGLGATRGVPENNVVELMKGFGYQDDHDLSRVHDTYKRKDDGETVAWRKWLDNMTVDVPWLRDGYLNVAEKWANEQGGKKLGRGTARKSHSFYADELMKDHQFVTNMVTDDLYVYHDGAYHVAMAESFVRYAVEEEAFTEEQESPKQQLVTEVIEAIKRRTLRNPKDWDPPGFVCFQNGLLDLGTLELRPFDPDVVFTHQIPWPFDAKATCPQWEAFMLKVLPQGIRRKIIQVLFGYCLEAGNPYQAIFVFLGSGNNGKTTTGLVLSGLLGDENVSAYSMQALQEDKFAAAGMVDKLANVCGDLPTTALKQLDVVKKLSGEDLIQVERKYGHSYMTRNKAKSIFAANKPPPITSENTWAVWRRFHVILFEVRLDGEEIRDYAVKLLKEEGPGILQWAIRGLKMLHEERAIPEDITGLAARDEMRRRSDPLAAFVQDCVIVDPRAFVKKDDFVQAANEYLIANDIAPLPAVWIGRRLPLLVPSVREGKPTLGKKGTPVYRGIALKPKEGQKPIDGGEPARGVSGVSGVTPVVTDINEEEEDKKDSNNQGIPGVPRLPGADMEGREGQNRDRMGAYEYARAIGRYAPYRSVAVILAEFVSSRPQVDRDQAQAGITKAMADSIEAYTKAGSPPVRVYGPLQKGGFCEGCRKVGAYRIAGLEGTLMPLYCERCMKERWSIEPGPPAAEGG